MFQKNSICVEAEYIDEAVIPTIPDSTLFGPTVKSESSGPAGGAAMADSPAEQTAVRSCARPGFRGGAPLRISL